MRYTPERKRQIALEISNATPDEAQRIMQQHNISAEELNEWFVLIDKGKKIRVTYKNPR